MTIDTSGEWWVGSDPEDVGGYLEAYTEDSYPVSEFRLARCECGGLAFGLQFDASEGGAVRTCVACKKNHFICDSEEYWEEAEPETWKCIKCGSKEGNIGVGFSYYEDSDDVRWLYVGVRCAQCGVLGCYADWKVAYSPSQHLIDHV